MHFVIFTPGPKTVLYRPGPISRHANKLPPAVIKVRDRWFRVITVLLPAILVVYTNDICLESDKGKIFKTLVSFGCILAICEGNRYLVYTSRRWKPRWSKAPRRIFTIIAVGLLFTTLALALSAVTRRFIATDNFSLTMRLGSQVRINNGQVSMGLMGYSLFNALFIFFFLFTGYETLYRYALLKHTEREKEVLEKEKLRAELNQLKGIVNPHFLFNNLNSLSSLIAEDPVQAEAFLDELTKVFRYLLHNNQAELTTLGQELQFIQSYYHLLQTRYGTGISMEVQIEKKYEEWKIPPLTLQLLVENAVKHNTLQKNNPLHIQLCAAEGNKLMVRNTLYRRATAVESTGIGLQNINARYKILNLPQVQIEKTDTHFTVIIALIEPDVDYSLPPLMRPVFSPQ